MHQARLCRDKPRCRAHSFASRSRDAGVALGYILVKDTPGLCGKLRKYSCACVRHVDRLRDSGDLCSVPSGCRHA
jgi:hypothetical protein